MACLSLSSVHSVCMCVRVRAHTHITGGLGVESIAILSPAMP